MLRRYAPRNDGGVLLTIHFEGFMSTTDQTAATLFRAGKLTDAIAAAQAAADGIAAVQQHHTTVYALQHLHAANGV